jgi:hypothetical protein
MVTEDAVALVTSMILLLSVTEAELPRSPTSKNHGCN